jgi:iron-sulfur cluster assembly protein
MAIEVTEKAAEEIRKAMQQNNLDPADAYLYVGAKGGGCSGLSYVLDLRKADQVGEKDEKFESHGIKIYSDPKSYLFLNGTTIDYKSAMVGGGFVFSNPQATGTCGCGSSFSA